MSQSGNQTHIPYGSPIGLDAALTIAMAAAKEARQRNWPVAIAVVDSGGHLVVMHRLDQAQHAAAPIAQDKARSAVAYRRATSVMEEALSKGGINMRLLAMPDALPAAGGLPLLQDGKIIGAIGVSGMLAAQDEEIAQVGLATLSEQAS